MGGTNDRENLVTSCFECNSGKSCDRLPREIEQYVLTEVKRREEAIREKKKGKKVTMTKGISTFLIKFDDYERVISSEQAEEILRTAIKNIKK